MCVQVRTKVRYILQMNSTPPRKLAALYDRFLYLLSMDKDSSMEQFKAEEHTLEEYTAEINKYKGEIDAINNTSVDEVKSPVCPFC